MSEARKTIQINPQYLVQNKKKTGGKNKKIRNNYKNNISIQSNNVREKLLQKIKNHRQQQAETQNTQKEQNTPTDPFNTSLEYLNSVIKKSETKKQRKRQRRKKREKGAGINNRHNVTTKIRHNDDPPWGILKGGKKPLYSEYRNAEKTLKKKPLPVFAQKSIHYEKPVISTTPEIIERKFKLKEFQKDALATQNKKVGKKKRNKTLKKKRYTLGKSGNTIGILIKSKATRKKIKKEHGNLKKKKIKDIKLYLKKHGLMKVGSNAPEELCRGIYETAMLSGDIYNKNSNILLHNYINDK